MIHPETEEWMAWLYGETGLERKQVLNAHLQECSSCAGRVAAWRDGMKLLDDWPEAPRQLPLRRRDAGGWWRVAAVSGLIVVGFLLGRVSIDEGAIAASVESRLTKKLGKPPMGAEAETEAAAEARFQENVVEAARQQAELVVNGLAEALDERLMEERSRFLNELRRVDREHGAVYSSLRKELETVAVLTEAAFRQTEEELIKLAVYQGPVLTN